MGIVVTLRYNRVGKIADALMPGVTKVLDRTSVAIVAEAKVNTPPRVDTGAMMNGWQVENTSALTRTVYNTQEYAIYHELGTSHMSAHPMLTPAFEHNRERFIDGLKRVLG